MAERVGRGFATLLVVVAIVTLAYGLGSHRWFVDHRDSEYAEPIRAYHGLWSAVVHAGDERFEQTHREIARTLAEDAEPDDPAAFDAAWFWKLGTAVALLSILALLGLCVGLVAVYLPNRFTRFVAASRLAGLSAQSVTRFVLAAALVVTYALARFAPSKPGLMFWVFEVAVIAGIAGNHLLAKHVAYADAEPLVRDGSSHQQAATALAMVAALTLASTLISPTWFVTKDAFDPPARYGLWSNTEIVDSRPVTRSNYARVEALADRVADDSPTLADARAYWKAGIVVLVTGAFGVLGLAMALLAVHRPNRWTRRISARGLTALSIVIALTATFKLVANKPGKADTAVWVFMVFAMVGLIANEMLAKHVVERNHFDPDDIDGVALPVARLKR